ncbi:MAG: hypothetical protein ACK5MQ_17595 [Pikeienuella sp.]
MSFLIAGIGLSTAFAGTAAGTSADLSDRGSAYFSNPAFIDSAYRPQICAFRAREGLDSFEARCGALLAEATADFLENITKVRGATDWPLDIILNLPEVSDRDGCGPDRLSDLAKGLARRLRDDLGGTGGFEIGEVRVIFGGQAGPGVAIAAAAEKGLAERGLLVAAVDSFNDRDRLLACSAQNLLFSDSSPYGLVPGEAAGLILLVPEVEDPSKADPGFHRVLSAGSAQEEAGERSGADSAFTGLSDCALEALDGVEAPVAVVLSDWNNSRYRAAELSYCFHRLSGPHLAAGAEPEYPGVAFGDVGAAFAPLAVARALEMETEEAELILLLASSTHSCERSAILIQPSPSKQRRSAIGEA